VLRDFWRDFTASVGEIKDLRVGQVLDALNDLLGPHIFPDKGDGSDPRRCPSCGEGRLSLKISGKTGAFIGCSKYPDCRFTRQLAKSTGDGTTEAMNPDGKILGICPDTGLTVSLRNGRFGAYVQLGDTKDYDDGKPKRASIPKGWDASTLDLERALKLLNLPRTIDNHPETGTPVLAGIGRYGPYILHDGTYVNLPSVDEVFDIGLNRAVSMIADKKAGKGGSRFGRGAAVRQVLKELGEHPSEGGKIEVLNGRYGPYVAHNKVNATVPRGKDPASLTVEEAIGLLTERIAKMAENPGKGKSRGGFKKKAKPGKDEGSDAGAAKPAKKSAKSRKAAAE